MEPINNSWITAEGFPDGAISTGIGFTIAWQRGPLTTNGRNGAFLLEVLGVCLHQLEQYQEGRFACAENEKALLNLTEAIEHLSARRERREVQGMLGSHEVDIPQKTVITTKVLSALDEEPEDES